MAKRKYFGPTLMGTFSRDCREKKDHLRVEAAAQIAAKTLMMVAVPSSVKLRNTTTPTGTSITNRAGIESSSRVAVRMAASLPEYIRLGEHIAAHF